MKHTEETKKRISETCKAKGVGKWMTGRPRPEELKKRQSEVMKKLVIEGKHNLYIDGRTNNHCLECNKSIFRNRKRCMDCAVKRGNQHWNWQGGITTESKLQRHSVQYKLWRESVFTRDNFTCVFCSKRGGYLEADHIKPFAHYPELRFAIDNGRTLCRPCHITTFKEVSKHKNVHLK